MEIQNGRRKIDRPRNTWTHEIVNTVKKKILEEMDLESQNIVEKRNKNYLIFGHRKMCIGLHCKPVRLIN